MNNILAAANFDLHGNTKKVSIVNMVSTMAR